MKLLPLVCFAALALAGCGTQAYQNYDRSHARRIDIGFDADTNTFDLGYTITPVGPVKGFSK